MAFEGQLQAEQPTQVPNVRFNKAETNQVNEAGNDMEIITIVQATDFPKAIQTVCVRSPTYLLWQMICIMLYWLLS